VREFVQQIHFVGIGGVGMSGIASVLLDQGYRVTGSDLVVGSLTRRLAERGAVIDVGHDARHIVGADVVVASTAVSTENVEDRLAPYKYPRWIEFVTELPKTATGKIQRFKLRDNDSARY